MKQKSTAQNIGIEFNEQIITDQQYIETLINANVLIPSVKWQQNYFERLHQLMLYSQLDDRKYLGSVVGIAILGFIGFVALGFSIVGIIAGGILGGLLGSYAGRKIKKQQNVSRAKGNKKLLHFDVFLIKLKCHLQICKEEIMSNKTNCNLNNFRFYLDQTISCLRPLVLIHKFKEKHATVIKNQIIAQVLTIIKKNDATIKALMLSYKISRILLKRIDTLSEEQQEALHKLTQFVLIPLSEIAKTQQEKKLGQIKKVVQKIEKLSQNQVLQQFIIQYQQNNLKKKSHNIQENIIYDQVMDSSGNSNNIQQNTNLQQKIESQILDFGKDFEAQFILYIDFFIEIMDMQVKLEDLNIYFMNQLDNIIVKEQSQVLKKQEVSNDKSKDTLILKTNNSPPKNQGKKLIEIIQQDMENQQNNNQIGINCEFELQKENNQNQSLQQFDSFGKELIKEETKSLENKFENYRSSIDEQAKANNINPQPQQNQNSAQPIDNNQEQKNQINFQQQNNEDRKIIICPQFEQQSPLILVNNPQTTLQSDEQIQPTNLLQQQQCQNKQSQNEQQSSNKQKPSNLLNNTFQECSSQDYSMQNIYRSNLSYNQIPEVQSQQQQEVSRNHQTIAILSEQPNDKETINNLNNNSDIDDKMKQLLKFSQEEVESWDKVTDKETVKVYKKLLADNPCILIKGEALLSGCTVEDTFQQIYDMNLRKKWDKLSQDFRVVEQLQGSGNDIIYFYVDAGFGVTKRDFLQKRAVRRDFPQEGCITILFFSIKHPKYPELKGFIRADSHISGYILKPVEKGCTLTLVSQCDIKGMIPKSIVNYGSQRAPIKWIENLKQGVEQHRKMTKDKK